VDEERTDPDAEMTSCGGGEDAAPGSSRRMRVLHVLGRLPRGGTERQLLGLLSAAHGRLWDARMLVLRPEGELIDEIRAMGVPLTIGPAGPGWSPRRLRLTRQAMAEADCVHGQLWGTNLYVRVAAAITRNRPAIVLAERRVEDWRPRSHRSADRLTGHLADAWIANSDAVADFVAEAHRVPRDRVTVIPNGLDATVFRPRLSDRAPGPARVGCLGRLVPQKGIDVAIDAVGRLVRDGQEIELLIAGEGPEDASLRNRASGLPVRFVGSLATPADVARFLHNLDLFVLPSRFEGRPNALLEARACGLPTVASDGPGIREAAGADTRLVPVDDPAALADAIASVIRAGASAGSGATLPNFAEVARLHLAVFEAARKARMERAADSG
jgi:glycosyltransferase involved in cell wall biosynthesis